jgi:hypothetical protein
VIFSRNAKVLNAWVIRWPERFAFEGKGSDYGDEWCNSKTGSLRNDHCYRPNRAVLPVKSRKKHDHAQRKEENGRNRRWQDVPFQGHIASNPGETPPSRRDPLRSPWLDSGS